MASDPATDQALAQIRGQQTAQEYDKLNPDVATGNQESFLNYSKLGNLPNITGDLFKELGETVKAGVTGLDTFFKERIRGEATASVDQERERTQNWLQGGDAPENVKGSVNANRTLVNNLQTAANQGQISQAYYQMRLDTIARDLRSRYPGYREHIDNVIADLTGGTPANKVITDLFHATTSRTDPEQKLNEYLIHSGLKEVPGFGDYLASYRQKNGTNPNNNELMTIYNGYHGNKLTIAAAEQKIKLDLDQGKADENEVGKVATQSYRTKLRDQMNQDGSVFSQFNTMVDDAAKTLGTEGTGTLSPDKHKALSLASAAIERKIMLQAEATISEYSAAKGSYGKGYLTTENAEKIRKEAKQMSDLIKSGLGEDGSVKVGYLTMVKNQLAAQGDYNQYEMMRKYPVIEVVSAARHLLGDNTTQAAMLATQGAKLLGETLIAAADHIKITSAAGFDANGDQVTPLKTLQKVKDIAPGDSKKQGILFKENGIDVAKKVILDPNAKDVTKTAEALYQDEFISKINAPKADRQKLYAELSAPEMTNKMKQLKAEGKPELFDRYANWVYETGSVLARPEIQTISKINEGNSSYKVEFDPKTLTFTGAIDPNAPRTVLGARKSLDPDATGRTVVDRMNALTAPIINVLKEQGLANDAIQFKLQETFAIGNFNLQDITKQEETKATGTATKTPNFRAQEPKDQSRVPAFSEGTLTAEDKALTPPPPGPSTTKDFHVAKFGKGYVIVPNIIKTEGELKKYLEQKERPSYGIIYDTENSARLDMMTAQDARNRGKYRSRGPE